MKKAKGHQNMVWFQLEAVLNVVDACKIPMVGGGNWDVRDVVNTFNVRCENTTVQSLLPSRLTFRP